MIEKIWIFAILDKETNHNIISKENKYIDQISIFGDEA